MYFCRSACVNAVAVAFVTSMVRFEVLYAQFAPVNVVAAFRIASICPGLLINGIISTPSLAACVMISSISRSVSSSISKLL